MAVLLALLATLCAAPASARLGRLGQPALESGSNQEVGAVVAGAEGPPQPPGYRNAWEDCGGVGASATERMRSIAATHKGFAKTFEFVRHAAQDCGGLDA